MLGAVPIHPAHENQHRDRGIGHQRGMRLEKRDIEIAQGRPAAERRRDRKVRHQQQRPDHREQTSLRPRRGINAAPIREISADHRIIRPHQAGEQADREDDRHRGEPRRHEREPEHIRLARAPIAVEKRGGARPSEVARSMSLSKSPYCHIASGVFKTADGYAVLPPASIGNHGKIYSCNGSHYKHKSPISIEIRRPHCPVFIPRKTLSKIHRKII